VLGSSVGSATPQPIEVVDGQFVECYRLWDIVFKPAPDGSQGYLPTSNGGGEYKVWVSSDPTFPGADTKTDNFKVDDDSCVDDECAPQEPPQGHLLVDKFYDADADGLQDATEPLISGWQVRIQDGIDFIRYTPVDIIVEPDDYTVTEGKPIELNWIRTTDNPVVTTVSNGGSSSVTFGNLCLGAGGGHTLGFWSNKNGQAQINDGGSVTDELGLLSSLNLVNANGTAFNPTSYAAFRTWLLNANATNMAYMLSAQLAAMALNVEALFVSGDALIYAPGTPSANTLGFASVSAVMNDANTSLGLYPNTTSPHAQRATQEAIKNVLDRANNNLNFVQGTPCQASFDETFVAFTGASSGTTATSSAVVTKDHRKHRHGKHKHQRRHR
jgi:hypothetical protein